MTPLLKIRRVAGKGRGVFAGERIPKGRVIEICPVIPLKPAEAQICRKTILDDYFFAWGSKNSSYALVLGYGELYNHSPDPNASYEKRLRK